MVIDHIICCCADSDLLHLAQNRTNTFYSQYPHPRREIFYWLAVVTTFALGTAAGDMTAITFKLGYLASGILFAILFGIPLVVYKLFGANEVVTFWAAYIFTRPLGASFSDWFGRLNAGGIGFGTGQTALALTVLIIGFVVYLTITRKE